MELRGEIEEHGRIVAIVNDEEGLQGFRDVWKADIYLDVDQAFYRALGDGKLITTNPPTPTDELAARIGIVSSAHGGSLSPDPATMGGFMIVNSKGESEYSGPEDPWGMPANIWGVIQPVMRRTANSCS